MMARIPTGIRVRHGRGCRSLCAETCSCSPSYEAWVFDKRSGAKVRRTFRNLSEAKGWRSDATGAVRKGGLQARSRMTLREAAETWLEQAGRGEVLSRFRRPYKPSVLRGYRADFERYVFPELGALRLVDVTADDFQALVDRLVGAGFSGSKVRNVLVPCQALYRRHRRQVLADPTDGLDLPEPGGRRERALSPAGAAALLAALPDDQRALWATAFYAGLRRGELRGLRVSDVAGDAISVVRGWDDYEGPVDPKSRAGIRRVPIGATLRAILDEHLERTGRSGDELVFGRSATAPFTPSHVQDSADEAWAAAVVGAFLRGEASDVERVTLHECRHSFSTFLDAAGISETRADRYMGHSNSSVANRYRHQLEGQLVEDAARLDEYLTGATAGRVVPLLTGAHSGAHESQTRLAAQSG
jgi:integrase